MKFNAVLILFLVCLTAKGQDHFRPVVDTNCVQAASTDSVYSDYYKLLLTLPQGWIAENEENKEDGMPTFYFHKHAGERKLRISITSTYNTYGSLDNLMNDGDSDGFSLGIVNDEKVLLEHRPTERRSFIAYLKQSSDPNDLWLWRVELGGAKGYEDEVRCDFTHVIRELTLMTKIR